MDNTQYLKQKQLKDSSIICTLMQVDNTYYLSEDEYGCKASEEKRKTEFDAKYKERFGVRYEDLTQWAGKPVFIDGELRYERANDGMIHYHDRNGQQYSFSKFTKSWISPSQCEVTFTGPSIGNTTSPSSFGSSDKNQNQNQNQEAHLNTEPSLAS